MRNDASRYRFTSMRYITENKTENKYRKSTINRGTQITHEVPLKVPTRYMNAEKKQGC
jgi:hypothetical protein